MGWVGSELSFQDSGSEDANGVDDEGDAYFQCHGTRLRYKTRGMFDCNQDAMEALNAHNDHLYTYDTQYETDLLLPRVFKRRSHFTCPIKIHSTRISDDREEFELLEGGLHSDAEIPAVRRDIHPILLEEVVALLKME
uniref:Uncharacterized protein n=1 Tax=Globisporangium ultimum (strain ATCC 200006 / CBS 805.95 / DAOM BR144) TaxID=431595 RepID=K3WYS0_GLOUD